MIHQRNCPALWLPTSAEESCDANTVINEITFYAITNNYTHPGRVHDFPRIRYAASPGAFAASFRGCFICGKRETRFQRARRLNLRDLLWSRRMLLLYVCVCVYHYYILMHEMCAFLSSYEKLYTQTRVRRNARDIEKRERERERSESEMWIWESKRRLLAD